MIALFKRPSRREVVPTNLPTLVARIDAMEAEAHRMQIGDHVTQIQELAKAAAKEPADERKNIAEIPGDPTSWGNLGEG